MPKNKNTKQQPDNLIYKLDIRPVNRQSQDIQKWRSALQSAENIVFPRRVSLYDLYADVDLDTHLTSVMNKRRIAISNSQITFTDKSGTVNRQIEELCETQQFQEMIVDIIDSRFWGHSLIEVNFEADNWTYNLIPRKHVCPEKGLILISPYDSTGIDYRDAMYQSSVFEAGKNNDFGLILKACPFVIYKRCSYGDWVQFAELFGMPFRKASYNGYDEQTRLLLIQALEQAGSAAFAVIPKEADLQFIENHSNGNAQLYDLLIQSCNAELSKLIVGQTLTTEQGDKGARSLGTVHLDIEEDIHISDRMFIKNTLNNKFRKILELNGFNVKDGKFDFKETDSTDIVTKLNIAERVNLITPVDPDYFYDTFNLPKGKPVNNPVSVQNADRVKQPNKKPETLTWRGFKEMMSGFFVNRP